MCTFTNIDLILVRCIGEASLKRKLQDAAVQTSPKRKKRAHTGEAATHPKARQGDAAADRQPAPSGAHAGRPMLEKSASGSKKILQNASLGMSAAIPRASVKGPAPLPSVQTRQAQQPEITAAATGSRRHATALHSGGSAPPHAVPSVSAAAAAAAAAPSITGAPDGDESTQLVRCLVCRERKPREQMAQNTKVSGFSTVFASSS